VKGCGITWISSQLVVHHKTMTSVAQFPWLVLSSVVSHRWLVTVVIGTFQQVWKLAPVIHKGSFWSIQPNLEQLWKKSRL